MVVRIAATESYFYENYTLLITFEWHSWMRAVFSDSHMSHLMFSIAN